MKQLYFGFFGEGPTDERYFTALLSRYLTHTCAERGIGADILEPTIIRSSQHTFLDKLRDIEIKYSGCQLFFVHMDADGRAAQKILTGKWNPWLGECKEPRRWIPVVPIKKLESWLLADYQALSKTFLISEPEIAKITASAHSESIVNPKEKLEEIKRAGKQRVTSGIEELIAQRTRLSELEKLPSFQAFARDVEERLDDLF
ncbi:MAG: DUF4276 family protein [Trueperaceae bacterium]|nr:DUF4276 family protein [Trueperaceae bacterium]